MAPAETGAGSYAELFARALARIEELEAERDALRRGAAEPVAVIGMACRFPGADGPEEFWELLREGRDATGPVPADRWDPDGPAGGAAGRRGGFVGGPEEFDAEFFGISPREAAHIDPQHRLLLEVAWEAVENAGIAPHRLPADTGVYVGIADSDYRAMAAARGAEAADRYFSSGTTASTASGRLSYLLGVGGPALSLDTACSSSAVAVHLAVRALRAGECGAALAAGVNRILAPQESSSLTAAGMLAPDGRCKPFDAAADGFGRAEGCGVLLLRRLSDALADRDPVLAVIRGTAVNQDGRRAGLTVPNGAAQRAVIRAALRDAGTGPEDVGYVEAQGTGSRIGDRIEAAALAEVFAGAGRAVPVGSAKSNTGHMEAAAGVAGVMKAVLALRHGTIPPTLHLRRPDPDAVLEGGPIRIPAAAEPWPAGRSAAGVSSFGFSGTNCHIVVARAPGPEPVRGAERDRPRHALALSAAAPDALRELVRRHLGLLRRAPDPDGGPRAADVCFTANTGRAHFAHRLCATGADRAELARGLQDWLEGGEAEGVLHGTAPRGPAPPVLLRFTGGTGGYAGMGGELAAASPTFRGAVRRCARAWGARFGEPLAPLAEGGPERAPADGVHADLRAFAVGYALHELLGAWGIAPAGMSGEEAGAFVAACVAGSLALDEVPEAVLSGTAPAGTPAGPPAAAGIVLEAGPAAGAGPRGGVLPGLAPGAEWQRMLAALAALYVRGAPVDWEGFERDHRDARTRVVLPNYPFRRTGHWLPEAPPERPGPGLPAAADERLPAGERAPAEAPLPRIRATADPAAGPEAVMRAAEAVLIEALRVPGPIGAADDFADLGMDSLIAAEVRELLQEALGRELPADIVVRSGSLGALAEAVAGLGGPPPSA